MAENGNETESRQNSATPMVDSEVNIELGQEAIDDNLSDSAEQSGPLTLNNDGSKFFEVLDAIGSEAIQLSVEDIAGGLQSMSMNMAIKGKTNITEAYSAAQQIKYKNGWADFKDSITAPDIRQGLLRAPVGVSFLLVASVLYVMFCLLFVAKKYGPRALNQISLLIKEKIEVLNEQLIIPMKHKLRPMITHAKQRLEKAIQDRLEAQTANANDLEIPDEP